MKNDKDVKFIRVNGRVVPIRGKNDKEKNIKAAKKAQDGYEKNRAQKKKNVSSASKGKVPRFQGMNTADTYWKAENFRQAARKEGSRANMVGAAGSLLALQGISGAVGGLAVGGAGGAASSLIGGAIGYGGYRLAKNGFAAGKANNYAADKAKALQTDLVREEMRRQGYKEGGSMASFDNSFERSVNSINNSAYRQGRKRKAHKDLYNSHIRKPRLKGY